MKNNAKIFAHRGVSGHYPENTMAAFQAALEAGADGIELDVQIAKDGKLVIIHDETVDRTTNGTGCIKDLTYDEIMQLDAGGWFAAANAGETIPELETVFQWAIRDGNGLMINVELKNDRIEYQGLEEKVIELIQRYGLEDRVILSSFNAESLKRVREVHPALQTGYLITGVPEDAMRVAKKIGADSIHCEEAFALSEYGREARRAGFPLRVYTVNDETRSDFLAKAGVEVIMTDFPERFLKN
ncbi:glycerophosphodiester phosphodiesterase [Bacillus sp. ISL-47]|uniref:glycerophosphodiester phosphodiesterase n=1 Tax=Bacillus sp. ISL-47 TaxID=2819130 RepID=UPI001BED329F|nr:glycerophosphodiester phosphodiesterase [Bacillus sp. ISL-47]MBT2688895.1 glycerophosphodiester phosphodiesterase [Bacillus sp. ISL-47]MBT2709080.1 glycerophosphodiester phosphodiesterase [Pseudomonas sp. ISL-84]